MKKTKRQGYLQTSGDHMQSIYRRFLVVKLAYGDCRNADLIKNNFLVNGLAVMLGFHILQENEILTRPCILENLKS